MSEETTENEAVEAKGGKGKLIIIALVVLLLVGGGGGAGYYFMFMAGGGKDSASKKSDKKSSKKKKKSDKSSDKGSDEMTGDAKRSLNIALQDDENVKHVIELEPFLVNLADSEEARYLRMTVSLGIGGEEEGEPEANPIFLARVKNAMLAVLSVKKSEDVLTVDGKAELRKQLLNAAQSASEDGNIEAIYITDFIVQL